MIDKNSTGANLSQNYIDAIAEPSREWRGRFVVDDVITDATIKSFSVKTGSMGETELNLWGVYSSSFEAVIDTDSVAWENATVQPQVAVGINDTFDEWLTLGTFKINEVLQGKYETTIRGIGTIGSKGGEVFALGNATPTIANIVSILATEYGVTIDTSAIPNTALEIPKIARSYNLTYLEVFGVIASVTGTFVTEKYDGTILFGTYVSTPVPYGTDRMTQEPMFSEQPYEITGVHVIVQEESIDEDGQPIPAIEYQVGTVNVAIENTYMTEPLFDAFASARIGDAWYRSDVHIAMGDPRLEPTDMITVAVDENNYTVACHSIVQTFDGGFQTQVISQGESETEGMTQSGGQITGKLKEIEADIITAKKIATDALSVGDHFFVGADGFVHITEETNDYTTGNNIFVDNDSVDVRDGTTSIASFGNPTRIGEENKVRTEVSPTKFSIYSDNNEEALRITSSANVNVPISKQDSIVIGEQVSSYTFTADPMSQTPVWSQNVRVLITVFAVLNPPFGVEAKQTLTFTSTSDTPTATFTDPTTSNVLAKVTGSILSNNRVRLQFTNFNWLGIGSYNIDVITAYYYSTKNSNVRLASDVPTLQLYNSLGGSTSMLRAYNGGKYGNNVVLNSGGNVFVGGGEYAQNRYAYDLGESTTECAYFGADSRLYIEAGADTIANRKTWTFDGTGSLDTPGTVRLPNNTYYGVYAPNQTNPLNVIGVNRNGEINVGGGSYDKPAISGQTRLWGNSLSLRSRAEVEVRTSNASNAKVWTFDTSGNVTIPSGGTIDGLDPSNVGTTYDKSASTSLASGTAKNITSQSFAVGTWLVTGTAEFPSNATGRRAVQLSGTSGGDALSTQARSLVAPVNGGPTVAQFTFVLNVTATKTYYLVGYQNSGSALTTTGVINAVRIK